VKPLAIDLFCGLGGWAEGFLPEGYDVIGFDIERHDYGTGGYPGQLVLQDVLTLSGKQFSGAALIVASPPCQAYSYMAMPWSRAKQMAAEIRADVRRQLALNCLFNACFRIAQEAGVPLVVENVKGAQPWVGPARAHFGSFYFWGDINSVGGAVVGPVPKFAERLRAATRTQKHNPDGTDHGQGSWFKIADSKERGSKNDGGSWFAIGSPGQTEVGQNPDGRKVPMNFHEHEFTGKPGRSFQSVAVEGIKLPVGHDTFAKDGRPCNKLTDPAYGSGTKQGGEWWHDPESMTRQHSSRSLGRKAASAQIAKIPFPLAQHIARVFKP
jgi:C-5 cytosine-specific DNA methylase